MISCTLFYWFKYVRNGERGRRPCAKRSYGLSGIAKRRKFQSLKLLDSSRYATERLRILRGTRWTKISEILRISSRHAKPFLAPCREHHQTNFLPLKLQFEASKLQGSHQGTCLQVLIVVVPSDIRLIRSGRKCDIEVPAAVGQNLSTAVRREVYE
ncbi:hypothetical protein E3N88_16777 [Mikania micrantha]|uniref:Uncharacterized protein n=1 Tax=Mikania micrantha TaxID=192012 RepID=A0A5N6NQ36_9ASTR|nr:hypothetical protein E3N88_16777 [Mikania micrantha]